MRARRRFAALFWASLLALATPAAAAWNPDGNPVCTAVTNQINHRIAPDGQGGAFMVWQDPRDGTSRVYGHHFDADGNLVSGWPANGLLLCNAGPGQSKPVAVPDGAGGVIVAWEDARNGNVDVYAQRFNAAGVAQWAVNGVPVTRATRGQTMPSACSDSAGGAWIAWMDERPAAITYDIYARRITAAGDTLGTGNGVLVCNAIANQINPIVSADGAGGVLVAWPDFRAGSGAQTRVLVQKLSAASAVAWTANGVPAGNSTDVYTARDLSVTLDGAGGGYVAWTTFTNREVFLQRLDATGAPAAGWPAAGRVATAGGGDDARPKVTADGTGGVIVSGVFLASFGNVSIEAIDAGGTTSWAQSFGAPFARHDAVADGSGGVITAFQAFPVSSSDIWFSRVLGGGTVPSECGPDAPLVACSASGEQTTPMMATDGQGGAIVLWADTRNAGSSGTDLYATHIACGPAGSVGGPQASALALGRVAPIPASRALSVSFVLPVAASAELALLDAAGRRVAVREVGSLGAGSHRLALDEVALLAPGVYFLRLRQGGLARTTRVVVAR